MRKRADDKIVFVRRVPLSVHRALKILAARQGKTLEQVALEALTAWVKR